MSAYQIKRCTAPCVGLVDEATYGDDVRHAIMFLEGKSEEMIGELVRRMESASHALEFERAARHRDQISDLRRVQARQYVSAAKGNVDVVAARAREGVAVVELFVIRNGQSLGSRTLRPVHGADASESEVLRAFLPQYYLTRAGRERPVPDEILLSEDMDGRDVLERALREQTGRRISVRCNVRGERARWIAMGVDNAELALQQQIASRASLRGQFEALQELLGLEEIPARIECFDVSHTGGESTVASCVVFEHDGPKKSDYRRFNISGWSRVTTTVRCATPWNADTRACGAKMRYFPICSSSTVVGDSSSRRWVCSPSCRSPTWPRWESPREPPGSPDLSGSFCRSASIRSWFHPIRLRCISSSVFVTRPIASRLPGIEAGAAGPAACPCSSRFRASACVAGNVC